MKKLLFGAIGIMLIGGSLLAEEQPSNHQETVTKSDLHISSKEPQADAGEFRIITDLMRNRVNLPPAEQLNRVVIIAPPLVATFASLQIPGVKLVGAHKTAFVDANPDLLDLVLPAWRTIPTGFLTGFTSNTEELLTLKPDVILVYGKFQQEGLQGVTIPILDFFLKDQDNEIWSTSIERLMRNIFAIEGRSAPLSNEWGPAKTRVNEALSKVTGEKLKGLMVMTNTGDKITVRGSGTYGDDWLLKSGLVNAAAEIEGDNIEVTMEQIYQWNPDIIYVFRGKPAVEYLSGKIPKQNWSYIEACQTGAIYDTPRGLMNWGAPNVDSPLMLQWMVSKNYPETFSEEDFIDIMKAYYQRRYGIEMTEELLETTLYPNGRPVEDPAP